MLPALGSAFVISPTEGTMCYGHWVLHLVLSHTRQEVRFVTGIRSASFDISLFILRYHTRDREYDLLRTLGPASCDLPYESVGVQFARGWARHLVNRTRNKGYDLLRAVGSASCDTTHETGGTTCNGHCALHLVISLTRQVVRFVTHIVFRILCYHTRNRGYDLLRALGSASCDNTYETGGTI